MAKTVVPDIASLKEWVGKSLGTTDWVTVSQEQIDAFATATGDHQWIHVDVDRARRESPFQKTIAHGYLTIALAPVLLAKLLEVQGTSNIVNYGIDKMRLPAAVPAGGRVRLTATLDGLRELPTGGARAVIDLRFDVEGGAKPACTAKVVYVYFP